MDLRETLARLKAEALDALESADAGALDALRVRYLGKKGEITAIHKQMGGLSPEERPVIGQLANEVRAELERTIEEKGR
ncbi:MAG: phenylalanine--tRNA ligase subunit alpha, partial [Oscillospiraceae bacterium]|nr:phenylalanine--tRNA ligase subunit alpha [Oscillospiraceae bacterium]